MLGRGQVGGGGTIHFPTREWGGMGLGTGGQESPGQGKVAGMPGLEVG